MIARARVGRAVLMAGVLAAARPARAQDPSAPSPTPPPSGFATVVTAAAVAASAPLEDRTAAASVVRPSDSPRAYDDLGSLLLEVPGVTVTRTGSAVAFSTLALRGSNPDEVMIYVDGVPLNIAQGGGVDVSTLPLGDVERVEVYRGSTPLAFGESALGGVVSITTRTPGRATAAVRTGMGSFGTVFGDATAGGRVGRLRLYVGAHVLSSRGDYAFVDDNNTAANPADDTVAARQNNDALEGNGVARAALTLAGRRTLSLGVIGFARAEGLPGPTNFPTTKTRFHTARGVGYLRYESRDDLGPGGRLSAQASTSVERDRLLDPLGELDHLGPMATRATTWSTGVAAHASRPLGDGARPAIVLEGRRETYAADNELTGTAAGAPARRLVGVAGGEVDLYWHRLDLHVIPSARVEAMSDVVTGQNPSGTFRPPGSALTRVLPVYRAGAVRPLAAFATLKLNAGRYARAPSFLELYGNGMQRLLGNPALAPETGDNADLGLWLERPAGRVALSSRTTVFGARADDLIFWLRSADGPSRAENLARARVWGVEQEVRLGLGRHARVVGQATYTVAEDDSDNAATRGKQIPLHPRYAAYARPELVHVALPARVELGAYADGTLLAGSFDDPANARRVPAQVLFGAGVSAWWPRAALRVTASALNLTDIGTWEQSYWPLPGRTVFVALAYEPVGAAVDPGGAASAMNGNLY